MKKMDRELKELRERLNQQAVRSLREEPVRGGGRYYQCHGIKYLTPSISVL